MCRRAQFAVAGTSDASACVRMLRADTPSLRALWVTVLLRAVGPPAAGAAGPAGDAADARGSAEPPVGVHEGGGGGGGDGGGGGGGGSGGDGGIIGVADAVADAAIGVADAAGV